MSYRFVRILNELLICHLIECASLAHFTAIDD